MAYTPPTYADFIARFPIFADTVTYPETVVTAILVEATNNIDTTWFEQDYRPAIMYLAAHMLATDDSTAGTAPSIGGPSSIASESFAGMSIAYAKTAAPAGSAEATSFGSTSYGRRYYNLLRKNKPPIVVA